MPERVERFAAAKVNLALHVLGQRADGRHDLETLAVFASLGECVAASAGETLSLTLDGSFAAYAPSGEENLVLRAAALLREYSGCRRGADIHLRKELPAGSGFGGGSADAAATLLVLKELWGLHLADDALQPIAERLGADVAMCLRSRALLARGAGETIELLHHWPSLPLVLVWPGRAISTAAVYAALVKRANARLPSLPVPAGAAELAGWLALCRNDLEAPALEIAPEIGDALEFLRRTHGCLIARMSGSGSGCFGLYAEQAEAEAAALSLRATWPSWWVQATAAH